MAFLPENPLETALMKASVDPAARPEFYRLLLESKLYVIGPPNADVTEPKEMVLEAATTFSIAKVPYKDRNYHPVFTSLSRLKGFIAKAVTYYGINGRALFEITAGASFLLNPGSDYGKELLPEEIAHLLDPVAKPHTGEVRLEKGSAVLLGQPAVYPQALVDGLKVLFSNRSGVVAAHLLQVAFPGKNDRGHPLIGVQATSEWQPLFQEIARVASLVDPTLIVDAVPIKDDNKDDTLVSALLKVPPFYTRPPIN